MELFNNHRKLFGAAFGLFALLTIAVAILPALHNQSANRPLPGSEPLTASEMRGKMLFIQNGCVACHTQQVRNVDMDKVWGSRPGVAADYARNERISAWVNTATLMGTERTGPDLTNVGLRQPGLEWNLLHLYQPRAVVRQSVMPAYPWLFTVKEEPAADDVVVNVPEKYARNVKGKVVATEDALDLVAYLQSLKQVKLPDGTPDPEFLYKELAKTVTAAGGGEGSGGPDGKALYITHCQACHQENGEGLQGAFPSLKGSAVVNNDNPELFVTIIMTGYDARAEYGPMPAVGENANLSAEEVAAIMNHERSHWGNDARKVSVEEVKKVMDFIKKERGN